VFDPAVFMLDYSVRTLDRRFGGVDPSIQNKAQDSNNMKLRYSNIRTTLTFK